MLLELQTGLIFLREMQFILSAIFKVRLRGTPPESLSYYGLAFIFVKPHGNTGLSRFKVTVRSHV